MVCFYEQGMVSLAGSGMPGLSGKYQWVDDEEIRVIFDTSKIVYSTDTPDTREDTLCRTLPPLLGEVCHFQVESRGSYPGPEEAPTPTFDPTDPSTYPAPVPIETVSNHVDGMFTVALEGDTLMLTGPSGVAQTFRRLIQEPPVARSNMLSSP